MYTNFQKFFVRELVSRQTRKRVLVSLISLVMLAGFEALSTLAGLYQLTTFAQVALLLFFYLVVKISFVFDLRLKPANSLARSIKYYAFNKHSFTKVSRILLRAVALRFQYLVNWRHFRHFQNYLILPSTTYWSIILLLFLRPFNDMPKQVLVVIGTLLTAVVVWHLKTVFVSYESSTSGLHSAMFMTAVVTSFLMFSGLLGVVWYFGLSLWVFVAGVAVVGFLLMYQSLFRELLVSPYDVLLVFLGAFLLGLVAAFVSRYWAVNYYTAGLLLSGVIYLYWGLALLSLRHKLTRWAVFEHVVVFLMILFYVLATTNFQSRIG